MNSLKRIIYSFYHKTYFTGILNKLKSIQIVTTEKASFILHNNICGSVARICFARPVKPGLRRQTFDKTY